MITNALHMTTTDTGDNDLRLDNPSAYRMEPQDPLPVGEDKEDLRKGKGPTIELQETREESAQLILKLNSRPFPREIIRMMSTFLDKAVEEESVAIHMSVMNEARRGSSHHAGI